MAEAGRITASTIEGSDIGLNVCKVIMPFVRDGEVLVLMDPGSQGRRYVCARAEAWRRHADQTGSVSICLHSIYLIAADRFSVPSRSWIGEASD